MDTVLSPIADVGSIEIYSAIALWVGLMLISAFNVQWMGGFHNLKVGSPALFCYKHNIQLTIAAVLTMLTVVGGWYLPLIPSFAYLIVTLLRDNAISQYLESH